MVIHDINTHCIDVMDRLVRYNSKSVVFNRKLLAKFSALLSLSCRLYLRSYS